MDVNKLRNSEQWQRYLQACPTLCTFDTQSQIEVLNVHPNVSVLADSSKWAKLHRKIKTGSRPIRVKKEGHVFYLFDVAQTVGDTDNNPRWTYKRSTDDLLIRELYNRNEASLNPSYSFEESFSLILKHYVRARNRQQAEFIHQSLSYCLFRRLGIEDNQVYDFSYLTELSEADLIVSIGIISNSVDSILSTARDVQKNPSLYAREQKEDTLDKISEQLNASGITDIEEAESFVTEKIESSTPSEEVGEAEETQLEVPTLTVGDMVDYQERTWIIEKVGFVTTLENVNPEDNHSTITIVGGYDDLFKSGKMELADNTPTLSDSVTEDDTITTEAEAPASVSEPEPVLVTPPANNFESENTMLRRGSGFVGGKFRIYDIIKNTPKLKDRTSKICDEYGIGGFNTNEGFANFNRKGLEIKLNNGYTRSFKWADVSGRIAFLIKNNSYITIEEAEKYLARYKDDSNHARECAIAQEIIYDYSAERYLDNRPNITELQDSASDDENLMRIYEALLCARQGKVETGYFLWSGIANYSADLIARTHSSPIAEKVTQLGELISELTNAESISAVSEECKAKCDKVLDSIEDIKLSLSQLAPTSEAEKQQTEVLKLKELVINLSEAPAVIDITNRNYDRASKVFPKIFDGTHRYELYVVPNSSCYEKLYVERINDEDIAIAHYYMQNGDMMYDPEICYTIDEDNKKLIPLSYEQSGLGIYYLVNDSAYKRQDLSSFTTKWLRNITEQGYKLAEAIDSITGERVKYFEYEKNEEAEEVAEEIPKKADEQTAPSEEVFDTLHVGEVVTLDNRQYTVTDINEDTGKAELRDDNTGWYPIFHTESIEDINSVKAQKEAVTELAEKHAPSKIDYTITDTELGVDKPREKYRKNVEAIKLLTTIESEKRFATAEEQEVLAQYVGWGGLADAFDESKWTAEYTELKELLSEEEYESAKESTLTAFYTQPIIVDKMYEVLESMGFKGGNVLEPAMAVGNFFGRMPADMWRKSKCYGVELDSISGRIAKQLYQTANIQVCGYENSQLPDEYFDVAISNVPFGDFKVDDKRYNKLNMRIHDYYFAKTIDKVHSGGLIAFITSKGTMDKVNAKTREYISERCEFLGAIRLPETAFKSNAGTEVVSDIIFLQKRDEITSKLDRWTNVDLMWMPSHRQAYNINQYFIDNPDMICGTLEETSTRFGFDLTVKENPDVPLEVALSKCCEKLKGKVVFKQSLTQINPEGEIIEADKSTLIPAPTDMLNGAYKLIDGEIYQREGAFLTPKPLEEGLKVKVIDALNIHDTARDIINSQYEGIRDEDLAVKQQYLNEIYDEYVEKHKEHLDVLDKKGILSNDFVGFLHSLEERTVNADKSITYSKAPIFSQRTMRQRFDITHCDTIQDGFMVSMQNKARIDFDYISSLCDNATKEEIINALNGDKIFRIPNTDEYVTADEYLSGNVREKLVKAKNAMRNDSSYEVNVKSLEAVQPEWLYADDISVRLGSSWIPTRCIRDFIGDTMGFYASSGVNVEYYPPTATWNITNKAYANSSYSEAGAFGTKRMNFLHILEHILNQQKIEIKDKITEPNGKERFVTNKKETAIAIAKADAIKEKFANWIWSDDYRKRQLERIYNENVNNEVVRQYDGSNLSFEGMTSLIELKPHQKNAVARAIYSGNTLLAHCVGAGKTFEMSAIAMEFKRVGIAHKSLIAVPNHLLSQWHSDFMRLYPNANILVATNEDFKKENRKRFISRIATGNYDAIIIGHSTFGMLQVSAERRERFYTKMIDECEEIMRSGSKKDLSVKEATRLRKMYEAKLKKLEFENNENVVEFEKLGVDALFIDEAHLFKNLSTTTRLGRIGGISTSASKRAEDLLLKTMYLSEINGGNKGVVFGTGTPISNSLIEMFTMQRYLQPDFLKEKGYSAFDAWASDFVSIDTVIELDPTGTHFRPKNRCSSFNNVPELMTHFRRCTDIQTADMLKLPVPKLKNGKYTVCVIEPSEEQKEFIFECGERAERCKDKKVDPRVDNFLKITTDGKMCAIDMRLVNPDADDNPDSKINIAIENIAQKYEDTSDEKLTQLVFLDVSTPSSEFNLYDDIRNKLVNNYGIPKSEIAFIHEAKNDEEKLKLFDRVNSGNVRIILGSTAKLGAGTNIQQRLCALHHLDVAWKPSDIEQREGRILRQGNINDEVEIFRYVTKGSFDAYSWQVIENKQKMISQVMTDKVGGRSVDDVDEQALNYAEIKMLATGDTRIKEHLELKVVVQRLQLQRRQFIESQSTARRELEITLPNKIKEIERHLEKLKKAEEYSKQYPKQSDDEEATENNNFEIVIAGVTYDNRKDGGKALMEESSFASMSKTKLGRYRGFDIYCQMDALAQYKLVLSGQGITLDNYLGQSITGNITRLDNLIDSRIPELIVKRTEELDSLHRQMENDKQLLSQTFPKEQEYQEKSKRLNELTRELALGESADADNQILDDEALDLTKSDDTRSI